jgi:hypothetical protein
VIRVLAFLSLYVIHCINIYICSLDYDSAVIKYFISQIKLHSGVMVASIAFDFDFEGSALLDYTALNVEAL